MDYFIPRPAKEKVIEEKVDGKSKAKKPTYDGMRPECNRDLYMNNIESELESGNETEWGWGEVKLKNPDRLQITME